MPDHINNENKPHIPKIGMRAVKTVIAVFICCAIDYFRGVVPFQSTIAAIICMQPDVQNSVQAAINRTLGTLLGGLAAALVITAFLNLNLPINTMTYYLVLCLLMLPLIYIPVSLGRKDATALTCIVFLVITLSHTGEFGPFETAFYRMLDTLVGIVVALPVNLILPSHHMPEHH